MDLSKYRCGGSISDYKFILRKKLSLNNPAGFVAVKNEKTFDLSGYTGQFPVGVILNDNYVIGWSNDKTPTNIYELEPHKSNPKKGFFWDVRIPTMELSYKDTIALLNYRCVQLSAPDKTQFDIVTCKKFEDSRHILWACVLDTNCITIDRLIELEVAYMKTAIDLPMLNKCKNMYDLQYPSKKCLEEWIVNQYKKGRFPDNTTVGGFFDNVKNCVKEMLS